MRYDDGSLIIYGVGKRGKNIVNIIDFFNWNIGKLVDGNFALWGSSVGKHIVESPQALAGMCNIILCITVGDMNAREQIRENLATILPYKSIHEISYVSLIMQIYEDMDVKNLGTDTVRADAENIIFDCARGLVLGGVEEWTKKLCGKLVKAGYGNTYILANRGDYDIPGDLKENILCVDYDVENVFGVSNIESVICGIKRHLPCVVITSKPNGVLLAAWLLKKKYPDSLRIVSVIHGADENIYQEYKDMGKCTDTYLCVSSDIANEMVKRGTDANKVSLMMCPVECPEQLKRSYSTDKLKPLQIGYAGRITLEQKRMDLLLCLIDELGKQGVDYNLELAGDGNYVSEIQNHIEKKNLGNRVKLIGKIERTDIASFWQGKDICINIADYEGRSLSIAEAMANGAVPVVTDTSGVRDDIQEGVNGFIVDIGDYRKMSGCIKQLYDNRELLPQMGGKAYLELKGKPDMEQHFQFWKELLSI